MPGAQRQRAGDAGRAVAGAPESPTWFSQALGETWVEVERGIYRRLEADDRAPPARPEGEAFEQRSSGD